jgi:hypothetical protein
VHDESTNDSTSAQLRLSFHLTNQFADFRVTSLGDLCIHPTAEGSSRNVGIGMADYTPTEKLDVDGTARLRKMPNMTPDALITGVRFDPLTDEDLVLNYLNFSGSANEVLAGDATWIDISNLGLCDWNIVNGGQDVAMGYGGGACVPGNVGIGTQPANWARLDVFKFTPISTQNEIGVNLRMTGGTNTTAGYFGDVSAANNSAQTTGIQVTATNGQNVYGGNFRAIGNASTGSAYVVGGIGEAQNFGGINYTIGLYGRASNLGCFPNRVIGVYGQAITNGSPACSSPGFAGYFAGQVVTMQPAITLSDEQTKTEIAAINNGLDLIMSLKPKSYFFTDEAQLNYNANSELQFGFLSQEVEELLPNLVFEIPKPLQMDENGNFYSEDGELKALCYQQVIPILVAAVQDLKGQFTSVLILLEHFQLITV